MFKRSGGLLLSVCLIFSVILCGSEVYAAGFQLFNELSAKAMGNSAAMSARNDAAELAWFNPAGSSMMDTAQITAGGALIFPSMELDTGSDTPNMKHIAYPVPYLYGAMPILKNLGASLSVNSPYGLTTEWDNDWTGRYRAHYTNLSSVFITPALSYRPFEWLSVSAGVQFAYVDAEMRQYVSPLFPGLYTKIQGHDWGQGYILAAMVRPAKDWFLGMTYHSYVHFNIEGHAEYDIPSVLKPYSGLFPRSSVSLPLDLPPTLSFAASTTALKNFRFSAEVLWTGWSTYSDLRFHYEQLPVTLQPGVVTVYKKWNDVVSLHFGVEYFLNDQWTLRASYAWDESPIEDDYRDPTLPTNDRNVFGFGIGYQWNHLTVDTAYSYVSVEDSKPGEKVTPELDGTYKGYAHIANVSFSWTF